MNFKLGLNPSLNFKMHFGDYVDLKALPPIPDEIDWATGISYKGTMFGNDKQGDCFWAAAAKSLMTKSANASDMLTFTDQDVLDAYHGCTGPDDNGTEPTAGFKYLQSTGIAGQKFGTPLAISPARVDLIMAAHHLCGGLMVGVIFFQEWEVDPIWGNVLSRPIGGHEIWSPKASRDKGLWIETWGEETYRLIPWSSLARNCTQLTGTIDPQFFVNGEAPNGLMMDDITKDAEAIAA